MPRSWGLRAYHRTSAFVLAAFLLTHIANHLVGIHGQADHVAFMASLRPVYRYPVVEPVLLALFAWQVVSGLTLVARGWRERRGAVAWIQAASGLYLAVFLVIHVNSVLAGRALGLDTDFRFAAAGFHVSGWPWYFAPYYFTAVLAVFMHLGCALYWNLPAPSGRSVMVAVSTAGAVAALLIVLSLAGAFYPVDVPPRYLATYGGG